MLQFKELIAQCKRIEWRIFILTLRFMISFIFCFMYLFIYLFFFLSFVYDVWFYKWILYRCHLNNTIIPFDFHEFIITSNRLWRTYTRSNNLNKERARHGPGYMNRTAPHQSHFDCIPDCHSVQYFHFFIQFFLPQFHHCSTLPQSQLYIHCKFRIHKLIFLYVIKVIFFLSFFISIFAIILLVIIIIMRESLINWDLISSFTTRILDLSCMREGIFHLDPRCWDFARQPSCIYFYLFSIIFFLFFFHHLVRVRHPAVRTSVFLCTITCFNFSSSSLLSSWSRRSDIVALSTAIYR